MERKKEYSFTFAVILLVIGVVGYAFPDRKPEPPLRIMLKNTAGDVLFDHKEHSAKSGYAVGCMDCHHDMDDEKARPKVCGECHKASDEDAPKRADVFHKQCKGCHDDSGMGPVLCAGCHML